MVHRYTKAIREKYLIVCGISVLTKVSDTTHEVPFFEVQIIDGMVLQKLVPCIS